MSNIHLNNWHEREPLVHALKQHILPNYLPKCRWFRSKTRTIADWKVRFFPSISEAYSQSDVHLLSISVSYTEGETEQYLLPIALVKAADDRAVFETKFPAAVLGQVEVEEQIGLIVDALYLEDFRTALFRAVRTGKEVNNELGRLKCETGKLLEQIPLDAPITSKVLNAEQSNTAIIYNDQYFLKIFRKLEHGLNPDLEIVRFLSEQTNFDNSPRYGGSILLYEEGKEPTIIGLIQNKIENRGDAWASMLEELARYYQRVRALEDQTQLPALATPNRLYFMDIPLKIRELIGRYTYERVAQLGKRTAEMHIALASDATRTDFAPTDLSEATRQELYQAQQQLVKKQLRSLSQQLPNLPDDIQAEAQQLLNAENYLVELFEQFGQQALQVQQTRVHGDYHLGQVLDDGKDFYIIDFEGEPMRSIEERRAQNSPFKDVAGMVRSLHYAAYGELYLHPDNYEKSALPDLEKWAAQWFHYMSQAYLTAYFDQAEGQGFVPQKLEEVERLLRVFIIEKAAYEVGYEMNMRPAWLKIPLRGLLYEVG